jgi:hypothetical protein
MRTPPFRPSATPIIGLLALCLTATASAQVYAPAESVTVVPRAEYKAGGLHRLFFGTHYRPLWTTAIRVPVLNLARFAGGLKPSQRGGGQQTKSLRLLGADGREYQFRSVTKDPGVLLPPELKGTVADRILQDQMSAGHPVGPVLVPFLLDSIGVLHTRPILVQMPDDPALGEFRQEFAGLLGTIEERPGDLAAGGTTFPGVSEIVGSDDLFKQLDEHPAVQVDPRAFLLARLTDVFLGDWDRHRDQWRWAKAGGPGGERWLPIPRDRDQAFVRFDGIMLDYARRTTPQLLEFGPKYARISGATWNGRDLDRRFLSGLERPVWDSVGAVLKARLTDQAIANAVHQLPAEYRPLDGAHMERILRARRDRIDGMIEDYYTLLAKDVDVYGSDKSDEAAVVRNDDGTTTVTLAYAGNEFFHRTFKPDETSEIRLYLHGGDDKLTVNGAGRSSPTVRVIGGGGDDQFTVAQGGGFHLYDDRGTNHAEGAGINRKPWTWKADSTDPKALPPRDWGRRTVVLLTGSVGTDVGLLLDYGGFTDYYRFRHVPYGARLDYHLAYATGKQDGRFSAALTHQFENSGGFWRLNALASGIETLRWYGLGNETSQTGSTSFHKVNQRVLGLGLRIGSRLGMRSWVGIGPEVRWSETALGKKPNSTRFIAVDRPYGVGDFALAGMTGELRLDGRDHAGFATKGAYLSLKASAYPKALDLEESIARLEGEGSLALAPQGSWRPSLNLMAGGIKTFGRVPYFETARLGGMRTLRGYAPDRFAGDAAVYGSAELRIPITRIQIVVPGEQGIFGFGDAGQVYVKGEHSDEVHTAVGGGIWMSFLNRGNVLFVGAGKPTKDKEGTRVIAGFGFPF